MSVEAPRSQSWRGISQSVNTRVMSPQGRKRFSWNLLRMVGAIALLGSLAALGAYLLQGFESPALTLAPVVKAQPLRDIVVLTDGVLTREWVADRLKFPDDIALMAIDLEQVKNTLQQEGQVSTVVVARDFPDTLVVTLEERVPVVRVYAAIEPGKPETLLVARDGTVYRGCNYDGQMINRLPWLDGIRLTRKGAGFEPLEGIDRVADLLLAGQQEAPFLAKEWRVISLAEFPQLVVRTREIHEIVFESSNYRRQFAWLNHILEFERAQPEPRQPERIDLSIAARATPGTVPQVPVKFVTLSSSPAQARRSFASNVPLNRQLPTPRTHRGL